MSKTLSSARGVSDLFVLWTLLLSCPFAGETQEVTATPTLWVPAANAVSFGIHSFTEDGESGTRVGVWWRAGEGLDLGITGRAWNDYDVVEPEARFFVRSRKKFSPILSVSAIRQRHGVVRSAGLGIAVGAEHYPRRGFSLAFALGWRFISRKPNWFRLRSGIRVFPSALL